MGNLKDKTVNERIAIYRRLFGYSQAELAELLGMKSSTYSQMERKGRIYTDILLKIAETLDIDPKILLCGEKDTADVLVPPPPPTNPTPEPPEPNPHFIYEPPERPLTNLEENVLKMFRSLKKKDKFIKGEKKEENSEAK